MREVVTHMLCCSCAMCFVGSQFLGERPGQHELGLENGAGALDPAVERGRHPAVHGMKNLALHLGDDLAGVPFVPGPIQLLGGRAELDQEVARKVLRLDLAALFPPQPNQGGLILAHDDPGVRAADKAAAAAKTLCRISNCIHHPPSFESSFHMG